MKISVFVFVLISAWVVLVFSLITDLMGCTTSIALFGRMGSILTLCAVALEYKISSKGQDGTSYSPGGPISMKDLGKSVLLTDMEKNARYFAHVSVILGTLIWGFGDLVTHVSASTSPIH